MKCKVASSKKRSIFKNMFCPALIHLFSSESAHFWEKQPGGKGRALNECLLTTSFTYQSAFTLRFMSACVALGREGLVATGEK
jgi:hypothetical protein